MATVEYILPGEAVRGMSRDEKLRRIRRLAMLARVMDTALRLPGTNIRFGADALMGMVPIFGDAAGALVGLLIVNEARQLGLPKRKLMSMLYNIGVDTAFGAVPLVGDAFDVYFKAHRRNIQIILDHHGLDDGDVRR
ncbi:MULTISPECIES: DUF4112 domain-containing protein [Aureimonas]|nr:MULTISPECIES: DUF4112 domain-containing protein [Aureimonas]